ncbi:DUF4145 domain-containing protein [Mesorhizobium sp. M7A.F.Ca.US.006.04.2.1]|uniref:DUF4145 domain-containing protein n=1 Tax=unclassified Mesorhizobium TaxID=325217 RepID=UPI000FCA59A9|nr:MULTISPECIES: DUF4145 domain-containing protein [unclassified Mesorhizobium]RUX73899.1 DUF4145 domain-containing protein [Mesorhizobium sp. M7A.F.Ca.US.005.03.1.1]RUY18463.1 DUF4145 domain-containing protein [Mesorhizobium sp. M7A.F.Ca.US.005.03.2.1]RVA90403.1 DUF4145 domain-containing protein [Mesorhizobium sp. M7A.F.Ca.US.006.04.2.1]
MTQQLADFAAYLSEQKLTELDEAIAVVWFLTRDPEHEKGVTVTQIAKVLTDNRLRPSINASRLGAKLRSNSNVVAGAKLGAGTHRIKASSDRTFAEKYADFLDPRTAKVGDSIISNEIPLGGRRHLEQIRREANGCYDRGFYNGSAVMCRRMVELLLVEAFVKAGHLAQILDAKDDIKGFGEIIGIAKSNQYIRLSRTTPGTIEKVKTIGDAAAHHRFYNTTKKDLDELNPGLRHVITELAALAGF